MLGCHDLPTMQYSWQQQWPKALERYMKEDQLQNLLTQYLEYFGNPMLFASMTNIHLSDRSQKVLQ